MQDFGAKEYRKWLTQVDPAPRVCLVGYDLSMAASVLAEMECKPQKVSPHDKSFLSVVIKFNGQSRPPDRLVLLPDLRPAQRELVLASVGRPERIINQADPFDAAAVRNWVHQMLSLSEPRLSAHTPEKKNGFSSIPHHRARGCDQVVGALCELPRVDRVRYRDRSGDECTAHIVGNDIHANFRESIGFSIAVTCTFPDHMGAICADVCQVLNQH